MTNVIVSFNKKVSLKNLTNFILKKVELLVLGLEFEKTKIYLKFI